MNKNSFSSHLVKWHFKLVPPSYLGWLEAKYSTILKSLYRIIFLTDKRDIYEVAQTIQLNSDTLFSVLFSYKDNVQHMSHQMDLFSGH